MYFPPGWYSHDAPWPPKCTFECRWVQVDENTRYCEVCKVKVTKYVEE